MLWNKHIRVLQRRCLCISATDVRVRFAPSPTGQLHCGGLRTALFNYLFAKANNGKFILRLEDTDQSRVVPGASENISQILRWAGIEVDEGPCAGGPHGPYVQSQRLELYASHAARLLHSGHAYCCFCTPRRLELLRRQQLRRREVTGYDNNCRHLTPSEVAEKVAAGHEHVVRLKLDPYAEPWNDLVHGAIRHSAAHGEGDPVLLKTDTFPTYHLACVVDDHLMRVSHVLRGQEWLPSTTKHLAVYRAFGWPAPHFVHLPVLLNADGTKLSKRRGDTHVEALQALGYSPDALTSLLVTTCTAFSGEPRGRTLPEFVAGFDLSKMKAKSSQLDMSRLDEFNWPHLLRQLDTPSKKSALVKRLQALVLTYLADNECEVTSLEDSVASYDYIDRIIGWAVREKRVYRVEELVNNANFNFIWSSPKVNESDIPKSLTLESSLTILSAVTEIVTKSEDAASIDVMTSRLHAFVKTSGVKMGPVMTLLRRALSDSKDGPPVAEMLCVLGRCVTLQRLRSSHSRLTRTSPVALNM